MATRAEVESELVSECGPYLAEAEMTTNVGGNNLALAGPIRRAIKAMGGSVSAPPTVDDADVGTVDSALFVEFIQVAKLFTLEKVLSNWPWVDMKAGDESQSLNQLGERLRKMIEDLREQVVLPIPEGSTQYIGPAVAGELTAGSEVPYDPFRRPGYTSLPADWPGY